MSTIAVTFGSGENCDYTNVDLSAAATATTQRFPRVRGAGEQRSQPSNVHAEASLSPGDYQLSVSAPHFQSQTIPFHVGDRGCGNGSDVMLAVSLVPQ